MKDIRDLGLWVLVECKDRVTDDSYLGHVPHLLPPHSPMADNINKSQCYFLPSCKQQQDLIRVL